MYKKLLSFFTLLVVLCMGTTAKAATSNTTSDEEESPVIPFDKYMSQRKHRELHIVSTAAEFLNHWKLNHSIAIAADIDLSGFDESEHQNKNFTGELCSYNPNGVTRFKLTKIPVTMAQQMTDAYIHDICFEDCRPEWDGGLIDNARGTSLVARYGKNCRVDNVVFRNVHIAGEDYVDTPSYGALIFSHDEGSTFIDIEAYESTVFVKSNYAGILCAKSEGSNFYRCVVMTTCGVYSYGSYANDGYAGAIAGYATNAKFTECYNLCSVSSQKDGIGGIVGHGENCTFNLCGNYGCVSLKTIGSAKALENNAKQMGAMTFTGSSSIDRLVAAGKDDGLGNILSLANLTEAYSIEMLETTLAQAYNTQLAEYNTLFAQYKTQLADYEVVADPIADAAGDYFTWRENGYVKIVAENPTWTEEQCSNAVEANYTMEKFEALNKVELSTSNIPTKPTQPTKPTKIAHSKATMNVIRGVSIALAVYQIWSEIYDELDSDEVGGIVGYLNGGSISRCANYGFVYCTDVSSGGIAGEAHNVNITNCMNQGLVQGYGKTGGIVGLLEGGSLKTCLNVGNVSNGNSSNDTFGRIYGQASGATISRNFFSGNVDRSSEDAQVAEVPLKMLATGEVAMKLNQYAGENRWRQSLGLDYYPNLAPASDEVKASNPNISDTIRTKYASDFLLGIMNQYSNIELEGDIVLNTSLANFSSRLMPFQGSIDGHGHRLKNLAYVANNQRKSYWWWSNDNENKNVGLFSFARNATFKNLELCDFNVVVAARTDTCALFVGNSANCTYENIHITGHSTIQADKPTLRVGGLVGFSFNDTFTGCTTGALCQIGGATSMMPTEEDVKAGGLVGMAIGSNFTKCINRAEVTSNNDKAGGIVGNSRFGKLERCLNMGTVQGSEYVGGMAGYAYNTEFHMCANTGLIKCNATLQESEVGGIVGELVREGQGEIYECANWGNVYRSAGENQGAIYGDYDKEEYGSQWVHDNYYCFVTEDGDHPAGCVDQTKLATGEWAYVYDTSRGQILGTKYYYQDIDNNSFGTHYPVPIAAAGQIYNNWDCKTQSYRYSNAKVANANHTKELDKYGLCRLCGSVYEAPTTVEIGSNRDMIDFAYAVNKGQNFGNSVITLTTDIDYNEANNYNNILPCIGTAEHPFSGTFDGNCHTISNLVVEEPSTTPGLFGTVTGNTTIRNLIMDNTCALRSTGWGAGGIVGCSRGTTDLNLINLGFEGFVSGYKNVGAILGGTFSVEGATINVMIDHCYNTGAVRGDTESASLCGYAASACVLYSWNAGRVTGYTTDCPIIRGKCDIMLSSYDINATGDNHITAEDVTSGKLAYYLNNKTSGWGSDASTTSGWYQQINVDKHPTFIRNTDHAVYQHDCYWCDAPETLDSYYDNNPLAETSTATVKHVFDENGICLRKAGEVHGEECPVVNDCWKVTKIGHLYYISEQVNSGKEQHDINLRNNLVDNCAVIVDGALNPESASFRQWTPIGNNIVFTKSFKGNNNTISGLYSNPTETKYLTGLFGQIGGNASVSNVGIKDSYFGNTMYAGTIAGVANVNDTDYPHISHCYASGGAVSATAAGGGIVGAYFVGNEPADFTAPITDCYNTCTVSAPDEAAQNVGGILGTLIAPAGSKPTVTTNCYYLEGCTTGTSGHGEAKSELAFRLGEVCHLLNEDVWSQAIGKQQYPAFGKGEVSYARKVNPGYWGSLILPFPVTSDEKVQYYTYKNITVGGYELHEGELHLQKVDMVPANTPCFFRTSADCEVLSATADVNSLVAPSSSLVKKETYYNSKVYLIGSYDDITVEPLSGLADNYFVAQNKLWWGERAFNLGAYRSYVKMSDSKYGVKSLTFVVDDDETGINQISPLESEGTVKLLENGKIVIIKNGVKYNAAGQRIL